MVKAGGGRWGERLFPLHIVTLFAGFLLVAAVVGYFAWDDMVYEREEALRTDQVYSARIESLLNSLFHKTDVMEAMIIAEHGELSEPTFVDLAKSLVDGSGIRAIQYLPDGVVTYVYPLEGNEATLGNDIFENPKRREDAQLAVETGQITLSGPYDLTQGGFGLVARNPIFMANEGGDEAFWGFAVVVLDLPEALEPIGLEDLENDGYNYELCTSSEEGSHLIVASSADAPSEDSLQYAVAVPNHDWTLKIAPKDGWVDGGMIALTGSAGAVICVLLSIVVRQVQVKRRVLHELATTDELTGLRNRRWFSDQVESWCAREGHEPFSVFYLDLNGFKAVNDTLGHKWGDELLVRVAERLVRTCGSTGALARMGGDEFVAARRGDDVQAVRAFADELRRSIKEPFVFDGQTLKVSASVGVARCPVDGVDYDALIRAADADMYEDKRATKRQDSDAR